MNRTVAGDVAHWCGFTITSISDSFDGYTVYFEDKREREQQEGERDPRRYRMVIVQDGDRWLAKVRKVSDNPKKDGKAVVGDMFLRMDSPVGIMAARMKDIWIRRHKKATNMFCKRLERLTGEKPEAVI